MSQNPFDLDSLENARPAARAIALLFGGLLILISAATSAAFFALYAGDIYALWLPVLSPYLAAATGVLVFEGAALAWQYLRANAANTGGQLAVANVGAWGGMVGGVGVTVAYFALSNSLITGTLDAATLQTVSLFGGALIVAGVALQFAAASKVHEAAMRATLERTMGNISAALPDAAARQGAANAGRYLADTFDNAPAPAPHDAAAKWAARRNAAKVVNGAAPKE